MALHNYSVPYQVTPSQPPSFYPLPPHRTPQVQVQGYNYPHPDTPFDEEDYDNPQNQRGVNNGYNPSSTKRPQSFQPQSFQPQKVQHTIHPIIDYDYLDDPVLPVAPIQGPIVIKNGTVPVVPLYSYPTINNGSFVQIPILWTALSVALGLELRGEYIRGVPCIKKNFQLFCPTAGNTYPTDRIDLFIDENKALMKRMYGEFDMRLDLDGGPPSPRGVKKKRSTPGVPDLHFDPEGDPLRGTESFASKIRSPRQSFRNNQSSESGRIDSCQSKVEIITPYWASNSAGKVRAIVNTQHFEQAIHQEVCAKTRTNRCAGDCGCEQKYKWHRLLAYDPDNDCKGIFMDWFLFPSCCVCRCNP